MYRLTETGKKYQVGSFCRYRLIPQVANNIFVDFVDGREDEMKMPFEVCQKEEKDGREKFQGFIPMKIK